MVIIVICFLASIAAVSTVIFSVVSRRLNEAVVGFFLACLLMLLGADRAITYGNGNVAQFSQKTEVGVVYRVVARTDDHLLIKNEQSGETLFVGKNEEEVPDLFVVSEEKKLIAVHDNK